MKKRILLISPTELCVGGVTKVMLSIVDALQDQYVFDVATLSEKTGAMDDVFSSYGGKIFRIHSIQYLQHKILHPLSFFQVRAAIKKILKENHYDAIHCNSGWQDGPCLLAAAEFGLQARISHGHGTYAWEGRNLVMRLYGWFAKKQIRKYATVRLACSSVAGNTLFSGASYENILNAVDVSYYANIDKLPHAGIHLLQIGYFMKLKNQIFTIKLLSHLRKRGVDAKLSLIGYPADPEYLEKMNCVIAEEKLTEYVSFLPHDFDKRIAFAQADYCLLPSEMEGLPLVALESQAAGVPCLMSDHISTDSDVGAGFFLLHDHLETWADTITEGVTVDAERLSKTLQTISIEAYMNKIRNVYEEQTAKKN